MNLTTQVGAVILVDIPHHAMIQQLVSRQRGSVAPNILYILCKGSGGGFGLNIGRETAETTKTAEALAALLNALDTNHREKTGKLSGIFGGNYKSLCRYDEQRYTVDHLGVVQYVHQLVRGYEANNPNALKKSLAAYGFSFLPDAQLIGDEGKSGEEKIIAKELNEVAQLDWLNRVAWVQGLGAAGAENIVYSGGADTPRLQRVLSWALELEEISGDWETTCNLLAAVNETAQGFKKAKDALRVEKLRKEKNEFVLALTNAFEIGEAYSGGKRVAIMQEVYEQSSSMRHFVRPAKRYSFSTEERGLDEREANRIFKLLFTVKNQRTGSDGARERVWIVEGADVVGDLVRAGQNKRAGAIWLGLGRISGQGRVTSTKASNCLIKTDFGGRKTAGTRENTPPLGWGVRNIGAVNVAELVETIPF